MRMSGCLAAVVATVSIAGTAVAVDSLTACAPVRRKFVAFAWEFQTGISPQTIVENARQFDASGLDGVAVRVGRFFDAVAWQEEDLTSRHLPALREMAKHPGLRESFIETYFYQDRRIAWTDDAAWAKLSGNMRIAAKLAHAAGLPGVFLDTEDYKGLKQFARLESDPEFDALAPLVRRRGRELFEAAFREYPAMKVLSFWLLSNRDDLHCFAAHDCYAALRQEGTLLPAFVNGMLDAMPPEATFIDGNECSYEYDIARGDDYAVSARTQAKSALGAIAPENRAKYRMQGQASFSIYMDAFAATNTDNYYYHPPQLDGRIGALQRNLAHAATLADEYVWFYGEKHPWIDWPAGVPLHSKMDRSRTWKKVFPKLPGVLKAIKDSGSFLSREFRMMRASGRLENCVTNIHSACGFWQDAKKSHLKMEEDRGFGETDGSSLVVTGDGYGCLIYERKARPGEIYAVRYSAHGKSNVRGAVIWTKGGVWQWLRPGQYVPVGTADEKGWRHGEALFAVPEGSDGFRLRIGVTQKGGCRTHVDGIEIYRLF